MHRSAADDRQPQAMGVDVEAVSGRLTSDDQAREGHAHMMDPPLQADFPALVDFATQPMRTVTGSEQNGQRRWCGAIALGRWTATNAIMRPLVVVVVGPATQPLQLRAAGASGRWRLRAPRAFARGRCCRCRRRGRQTPRQCSIDTTIGSMRSGGRDRYCRTGPPSLSGSPWDSRAAGTNADRRAARPDHCAEATAGSRG